MERLSFSDLLGREELHRSLFEAAAEHRASHAYIFAGSAGMGKQTLAHAFAAALLCEKGGASGPCGRCASCLKCKGGSHPDITVLEGEGKTGVISVDAVRRLRSDAYIRPNEGEYKVYILPHADKMQIPAQNALLKIFEEPPPYAVILLLTEKPGILLATIRSRAALVALPPLSEREIETLLQRRFPALSPSAKEGALLLSDGNPGLALAASADDSLADTLSLINSVCGELLRGNLYHLLKLAPRIAANRETALSFCERLTALCGLSLRLDGKVSLPALDNIARLTKPSPQHIIELLPDFIAGIYGNGNLLLLSESFLIKCWRTPH